MTSTNHPNTNLVRHFPFVDSLKGLAILGVLLVHYCNFFGVPNFVAKVFSTIGGYCPQIFFVISSFLLCITSHKYDLTSKGVLEFYKSKAKGILPAYYIALVIVIIISTNAIDSLRSIVAHFTLVNGFSPHYINDMLTVEWYIADLILLILCFPLFSKYINSFNRANFAFVCSIVVVCIIRAVSNNLVSSEDYDNYQYWQSFNFANQLPAIFLGFILYYLHWGKGNKDLVVYGAVAICSLSVFLRKYDLVLISSGVILAGVCTFVVVVYEKKLLKLAENKIINVCDRLFRELGRQSLGLYLFHMLVIWSFLDVATYMDFHSNFFAWVGGYMLLIIISFAVAKAVDLIISRLRF